ncbi:hypothetical protein [Pseudaestuariivita rosea]|uniref:hypothetical protein n=1 Tax=Pseudaestuariivita rosea TaxID=2763263 RepID=UPI001ABBCA89|nr:hypothetical protein [Pseudaestuariivita rosea]
MTKSYLVIDDLTDHLHTLPDWYIQVLEARETNVCDNCPENWIEIQLIDLEGQPISGEPWFVYESGTDTRALDPSVNITDQFLTSAGQTTPLRLPILPTVDVVDLVFGEQAAAENPVTDAGFGIDYDEIIYTFTLPAEYDGPLQLPSDPAALWPAGAEALNDINRAIGAGAPKAAVEDMLGELNLAVRAALGLYEDLSLTARNEAEAKLILALQGRPPDYHLLDGMELLYEDAELVFRGVAPAVFVGPDGRVYGDAVMDIWRSPHSAEFEHWRRIVSLLNILAETAFFTDSAKLVLIEEEVQYSGFLISAAHASPNKGGGGSSGIRARNGVKLNTTGKGSNPKAAAPPHQGQVQQAQANHALPAKTNTSNAGTTSNTTTTVEGVKFNVGPANNHVFREQSVKTNGDFYGGHIGQIYGNNMANSAARPVSTTPHPNQTHGYGIYRGVYQPRRQAGSRDQSGRPRGGQFGRKREKTYVDTSVRSVSIVVRDMRQALRNAILNKNFDPSKSYQRFDGYTNTNLKMQFYVTRTGNTYRIESYHYDF